MRNKTSTFDAIVIGSGIGGLSTAALLARVHKMRVVVLEKHFEMGGLTHVFRRGRYKWDVGLHYVGRMATADLPRVLFDFITNRRLKWKAIKSPFERFIYPGFSLAVPSTQREYKHKLVEQFPESESEINTYFRHIKAAARWQVRFFLTSFLPRPAAAFVKVLNLLGRKRALMTTAQWFDKHGIEGRLRALLLSQWGDYGTPPQESAFAIHATIVNHYLEGGYFPAQHSSRIAATIEQTIEQHGGMVLINREVTQIIVENGRAAGVRVTNHALPGNPQEEYYAPVVVSATGADITFHQLLPRGLAHRVPYHSKDLTSGCSGVTLYLGLKESPAKLGLHGENLWINRTTGHESMQLHTEAVLRGEPLRCFVSFPTLRSGRTVHHTAEIVALVDYAPFERWKDQEWRQRDREYYALKERIGDGLLRLVEEHLPGLTGMVDHRELSTPLTIEYFTNRPYGAMYGYKPDVQRFRKVRFRTDTPIKGLYLAGSDQCAMGIAAGMMSGLAAASAVSGPLGLLRIVGTARACSVRNRRRPAAAQEPSVAFRADSDKVTARLSEKVALTDTVFEFTYELPRPVQFLPGQFAKIQYGDAHYGAYSIAGMESNLIRFIIDTKFGGMYADYFRSLAVNDTSTIRLPIGHFGLRQNSNKKVFFATGTGISPFLPMLATLARTGIAEEIDVFFGCRHAADNFIGRYLSSLGQQLRLAPTVCISAEKVNGHVHGRITDMLHRFDNADLTAHDFYVSGNPMMVREVTEGLRAKGAPNVYFESY